MLFTALRFVVALTDVAITKIDQVRARRAAARSTPPPITWRARPHLWNLAAPPRCIYCDETQTSDNEHGLCSATARTKAP